MSMGGCPDCDNCDQDCNPITIPSGQDGEDGETAYVAYADDDQGNGFSTTDHTKDYIAVTQAKAGQSNDKSLHSGNWHFWGGSGGDHTRILYSDSTESSTTNSSLTQLGSSKQYTIPGGTLDTNGEALHIKAYFRMDNTYSDEATVQLRAYRSSDPSTTYSSKVNEHRVLSSDQEGLIEIYLIRKANDGTAAETEFDSVGDRYYVSNSVRFFEKDISSLQSPMDWDNDDVVIEAYARKDTDFSGGNSEDPIICSHLSIEIVEKV